MHYLLDYSAISENERVALMTAFYERLQPLMIGHVGSVFVCLVAFFEVDARWATVALVADIAVLCARCFVVLWARRQRQKIGDVALLRSEPWYHAIGIIWAVLGGAFAGSCVAFAPNEVMCILSITLAFGIASGIGARNFGTVRLATLQQCAWLLPISIAGGMKSPIYLVLSIMTLMYVTAVYSLTRSNHRSFLQHMKTLQTLHESESELRMIFANLRAGLNETNAQTGQFLRVNPEFCRIVGRSEVELLGGLTVADITHSEDRVATEQQFATVPNHPAWFEREKRFVRPDGSAIWTRISVTLVAYNDPARPPRYVTVVHDITARKAAEAALAEKDAVLRLSMKAGRIGWFQRDIIGGWLQCDAVARSMHGLPEGDEPLLTTDWEALMLPEDRVRLTNEVAAVRARRDLEAAFSYRIRRLPDGSIRHFESRSMTRYDSTGRAVQSFGVVIDVTDRREAELRIQHLAHHDPLTDLPNRVLFQARLAEALARAQNGVGFMLFCIDLDRFKEVNDTLGHPVGDLLLQAVTKRLCAEVRESDTVARLGGDEFAVIVASVEVAERALALAERLVRCLSAPFDLAGHLVVVGASLGVAMAPDDGDDAEQLLKNADLALYRAKHGGGGRICRFAEDMDAEMVVRRSLGSEMRHALQAGEFVLFYQPIVRTATREVKSFEALIRWQHPQRGLISPDQFIPLAEDTGLILPIGHWVLREACLQAAGWAGGQTVAVNVSAVSFTSPGFVDSVADALRESALAPSRLVLELTETVMLQDADTALATLQRLRALGVLMALDDFGTGFSSLSYLQRFPFDKVKIDRTFILDLEHRPQSLTIVRAMVELCHALGMDTTAEGVETEAQFQAVQLQGCHFAQGYLISPPVPASALGAFLSGPEWQGRAAESQAA
jgi:diguanylate cyclase (GGDEF)-like protein/PAS domain S-box-containing protein